MYFGEKSANEKRNSAMSMCTSHIRQSISIQLSKICNLLVKLKKLTQEQNLLEKKLIQLIK